MVDSYTYNDLVTAYRDLGVKSGRVIYVTSDLGRLMAFEKPGKQDVLEAHYEALTELIGSSGTLVVPTASMDICNTDTDYPEGSFEWERDELKKYKNALDEWAKAMK